MVDRWDKEEKYNTKIDKLRKYGIFNPKNNYIRKAYEKSVDIINYNSDDKFTLGILEKISKDKISRKNILIHYDVGKDQILPKDKKEIYHINKVIDNNINYFKKYGIIEGTDKEYSITKKGLNKLAKLKTNYELEKNLYKYDKYENYEDMVEDNIRRSMHIIFDKHKKTKMGSIKVNGKYIDLIQIYIDIPD